MDVKIAAEDCVLGYLLESRRRHSLWERDSLNWEAVAYSEIVIARAIAWSLVRIDSVRSNKILVSLLRCRRRSVSPFQTILPVQGCGFAVGWMDGWIEDHSSETQHNFSRLVQY